MAIVGLYKRGFLIRIVMDHDEETLSTMEQCYRIKRVKLYRGFDGDGNWVMNNYQNPNSFQVYTLGDHYLMVHANGDLEMLYGTRTVYKYREP